MPKAKAKPNPRSVKKRKRAPRETPMNRAQWASYVSLLQVYQQKKAESDQAEHSLLVYLTGLADRENVPADFRKHMQIDEERKAAIWYPPENRPERTEAVAPEAPVPQ